MVSERGDAGLEAGAAQLTTGDPAQVAHESLARRAVRQTIRGIERTKLTPAQVARDIR